MSADSAWRLANVVGNSAFLHARERDDQFGGAVPLGLGVHASYPCGGERASVRLPLRKNYDLGVGINDSGEDWSYPVEEQLLSLGVEDPTNFSTRSARDRENMKEIRDDQLESIDSDYLSAEKDPQVLPDKIFGSPSLQSRIRDVLGEYKEIFRLEIRKGEPAKLEPFELEVRNPSDTWLIPAHKLPPRRLDRNRQRELQHLVDKLEKLGAIQLSTATHYSHPFVVPKPDNKGRLVIDYKNLNRVTTSESWPIPNIRDMIYRIGASG